MTPAQQIREENERLKAALDTHEARSPNKDSAPSTPQPDRRNAMIELRPEVAAFAQLMETRLQENDHKDGWKEDWPEDLFERLRQEAEELDELISTGSGDAHHEDCDDIAAEAADVANFAMFIVDVCRALPAAGQEKA